MNQEELNHKLNSTGKGCFVRYFGLFEDFGLSNSEVAKMISNENNYSPQSCLTRVSNARSIINSGCSKRALEIVLKSNASSKTRKRATQLIESLFISEDNDHGIHKKPYHAVFKMPTVSKISSRTSSITNAFINAVVPVIYPDEGEIRQALNILEIKPENVTCSYCGDKATEWDHLRALVKDQRPTGYISEIRNLVPACGKCNQSKGNKPWKEWMTGEAKLSPASRRIPRLQERIIKLEKYEQWGNVKRIDIGALAGNDLWEKHWENWALILDYMKDAQHLAEIIRHKIDQSST
ncbi:HNH endonuclease [Neptuniibacter sp. QD37_11]|uniref:HNH endonuclease n=1 Tax=Neptuniibacter sp. QD37_11 TaxID=3398209 RepID=UPI0039F4C229